MADWTLAPDRKTLLWQGQGGAPLLSGTEQKTMRTQLGQAPTAQNIAAPGTPIGPGGSVGARNSAGVPLSVINQGKVTAPFDTKGAAPNAGNTKFFSKGGTLPSGMQMVNGVPTAMDTSFAGKNDTIVQWPDGHKTVLMANGLSVDIPGASHAEAPSAGGGGGGSNVSMSKVAKKNPATKVLGPQTAKDLLPAFSPPAINQFPNFYDPGAYAPVAGSSNLPPNYSGPTNPDIGSQASVAHILGVPWSAQSLSLTPGQNGYGMPAGNNLKNNYVDPRVYGYIAPTMAPAYYQNARSTAK